MGPASASRTALIIGVDKYSFISEPNRQLQGAETDTSLMKRMLDLFGFQSTVLLRGDANRKRIVQELQQILDSSKRDDEVVFYFSGRGSIAPDLGNPSSKAGFEPTLVPVDGTKTSLDPDIRIKRLEDWASSIDSRGAHVTIILDTSFQSPTRSDFGRQYNPTPRCVQRPMTADGEVRDQIYGGPGVFLSACPAKGSAYEWLVDPTRDRWGGAFTDQFVNSVVAMLNRGEQPNALDAMREVQSYFKDKVRVDYMPGLSPYPGMDVLMGQGYDRPFFGGLDIKNLPADSRIAVATMDRLKRERERKLRVALEVTEAPSEAARQKTYRQAGKDLADYLSSRVPNSEFAPEGAPPDVIVRLKSGKSQVEASVIGDDLDKTKAYTFAGRDLRGALSNGLSSYLEQRGLVLRLARLTSTQSPTWDAPFRVATDDVAYSKGDSFGLDISAPAGALLFILDRDDADGILQLAFPQPGAPYSQKLSAPLRIGAQIQNDTSTGRMMLRAIIVPSNGATKVGEVQMKDEKAFRVDLLRQLRAVVDGMENNRLPWAAKTINLRIR